jgi:cardiolipin synthase A/B
MPIWEIVLILIGVGALGFCFLALFTSLGDGPQRLRSSTNLRLGEANFFSALENAVHDTFRSGGQAHLIHNGDGFFPALHAAIAGAQRSINIMVFIWMRGPLGDGIFEALIARARAGVKVRLLLDALGCALCSRDKVEALRQAGGQVVFFRPLKFGLIHRFHRRNHARAFVFDGELGFTGGMAIEGRWEGHAQDPKHWRDMMVKTTGAMTQGIQSAFATLWANATGEILAEPSPSHSPATEPQWLSVISSPSFESHPAKKVFWISCAAATTNIFIRNSYFVPGRAVSEILQAKAKAGVDVSILVPDYKNDQKLAYYAGRYFYEELMAAGVKIYEYKPTMIHSKTVLVDDTWSIFGSANLDIRSHELNEENMLGIYDPRLGAEHRADFESDLAKAERISLIAWQQRPWYEHALERLCVLFAQQL